MIEGAFIDRSAARDTIVDVVTDERTFDALRDRWNALLDDSGRWNPFLTWEWMRAWWTHLRGTAVMNIVTISAGEELIAIAPLMAVRRGVAAPQRLEFIGAGSGADYLDVIVRPGHDAAAIAAVARTLESRQLTLHLDNLPPGSVTTCLSRQLATTGWTAIGGSPDVCPFIDLTGRSWDSYLSSLGSAHRANVRRRMRAMHAAFDVRFDAVESPQQRELALEALFAFHEQRWRDRGGSTAFSTAALRAFHHDITHRALDAGWLRMHTLTLNNALAGVMYGFARHGRFYFFQHGTDAALAASSPGLVLMALTIRAAIEDGLHEFDLLYGHETYKTLWTRDQRPLGRLMVFPPRLMGRWLQRRAETRLAMRDFAHRLGLKRTHDTA